MGGLPKEVQDTFPFIFRGKAGISEKGDYNTHPTVKPVELMAYLVILASREGEMVLDPFMGSGSTCVAAKILQRLYTGIDLSAGYIKIAERRLREWQTVADLGVKRATRRKSDFLDGYDSDTFV
jgi:site-specific DNA-methyltransferase (adenine-specific)